MAADDALAARVRERISQHEGWSEQRMFGGIGFLIGGHMAAGISGSDLMARVGAEAYARALTQPGARPFDMSGRPMTGWVRVAPEGTDDDAALAAWLDAGIAIASSLPAKGSSRP